MVLLQSALEELKVYQNPRAYGNVITKTADYTITIDDITNGTTIMVDTTASEVTLTLPDPSGLPNDDTLYTINVHHPTGSSEVIIYNPYNWVYGNEYFDFGSAVFATIIGGRNTGSAASYGLMRNLTVFADVHREATLLAADFQSATDYTTIRMDDLHDYNNMELIRWEEYESDNFTAVVDKGDGTVGLTITGHAFRS